MEMLRRTEETKGARNGNCQVCGSYFYDIGRGSTRKYCSYNCKKRAGNRRNYEKLKTKIKIIRLS